METQSDVDRQEEVREARAPASGPRPLAGALAVGVDLGKVTTSLAVGRVAADGSLELTETRVERHSGEPLRPFLDLYGRLIHDAAPLAAVVATGAYADRLDAPIVAGVPDEIAQEYAARVVFGEEGALNVVRVGGSGYSVLTRDAAGRVRYEPNERCSAGTGETVEGLCSRLGSSLERAVELAQASPDGIVVTSRCAVFAKSELTHYANEGEDHGRIFRGVFESVARNVHALYDRTKVDGPVVMVGNGALIAPVVEAFSRLAGVPVVVPSEAGYFEALGVLRFGTVSLDQRFPDWPSDGERLVHGASRRIRALTPAARGAGAVVSLDNGGTPQSDDGSAAHRRAAGTGAVREAAERAMRSSVVLGLDLGSTGSKAVLLDPRTGDAVTDVYRRTEGNPVEAAKALVAELLERAPQVVTPGGAAGPGLRGVPDGGATAGLDVAAVGVTGSGRDAVATVLRAAYPDLGARLTVLNEIVAHAAAAVRVDPDGGRSLSIVEIGGQDAKFINVRDGRVVESDMNKVCSAGTGSFLEEQAIAFGLDDIAEFGELATRSQRPPDLGQTCTVFVADVAAEALAEGYTREDIFAGLQYSVIRNYKGRVMGDRRFLDRVFFQGKPASNPSLARTLAAVTAREVVVPENPGAMGAVGIALLAAEAAGLEGDRRPAGRRPPDHDGNGTGDGRPGPESLEPIDLSRFLSARVAERREFRCGDRHCSNFCHLEAATIEIDGDRRRIVSGGTCPKYDDVSEGGQKLPKDAPNAFREREELLERTVGDALAPRVSDVALSVALPQAHYLVDFLPFFATFLNGLGHGVEVLQPSDAALAEGDRRCSAAGACAPVKMAHGLVSDAAEVLFLPKFIHAPYPNAGKGTFTCPLAQGASELVESALRAEGCPVRVLRPVFLRADGEDLRSRSFVRELLRVARQLAHAHRLGEGSAREDATLLPRFWTAYRAALDAQERYEHGLREIGARSLAYARAHRYPIVLMAGETHVLHDAVLNSGIHDLVAANGAVAVPVDCFPVPDAAPPLARVHWASAGSTLRAAVAAVQAGDVYPLLLGAYGCGPNSFVEHLFNDLLADHPHTVLETDGHGGRAGYVTRVQAFLHAVRSQREERRAAERTATRETIEETASEEGSAQEGATEGHPLRSNAGARPARNDVDARLARYDLPVPRTLFGNEHRRMYFGNVGGALGRQLAAAMRGAGLDVEFVGATDPQALQRARDVCSGKECLPYQLIWGTLARFLEEHEVEFGSGGSMNGSGDLPLFISIGRGFQACRANVFPTAQEIGLASLGLGERVEVADFTLLFQDWYLTAVVWAGIVAVDLLNMMRFYHYADEPERGAADRVFEEYAGRLEELLARPRRDGPAAYAGRRALTQAKRGVAEVRAGLAEVEELVASAARTFARLGAGSADETGRPHGGVDAGGDGRRPALRADLRDVFLCGDIYLRVDEWGNDDLQRKLADNGLRPIMEPFGEFFELLCLRDVREHGLASKQGLKRAAVLRIMRYVIARSVAAAGQYEPWLFWEDIADVEAASRELFDGYPFGESIPTIGGALRAWQTKPVDGIVVVSPRGCGPALISEAQLRRRSDLPLLFVYNDGDPIDEARLNGFAWRLRQAPSRRAAEQS
jgi:activator of 2-hydroxyglutaryl-CoA dehydratase/predicted nucleotide-binding protein (sugar kinase/HSP70/actin superfamily)